MKNKKLKLEDLKVQSFVTFYGTIKKQTIQGGFENTHAYSHCFCTEEGGPPPFPGSCPKDPLYTIADKDGNPCPKDATDGRTPCFGV